VTEKTQMFFSAKLGKSLDFRRDVEYGLAEISMRGKVESFNIARKPGIRGFSL
jgi:hypothetical protein